jgi:hypothetical protein
LRGPVWLIEIEKSIIGGSVTFVDVIGQLRPDIVMMTGDRIEINPIFFI